MSTPQPNNHPKTKLTTLVCQTKLAMKAKNGWLVGQLLRQLRQAVADIVHRVIRSRTPRRVLVSTLAGATLLGGTLVAIPVRADGITVTAGAGDVIDANGGVCVGLAVGDLPGADGKISLREAVCAANTNAGIDTITIPADTISLVLTGTNEDAAATGDLDVITGTHLILTGAGSSSTIIDGNATDRIFDVFPGATLEVSGVTIQNGQTESGGIDDLRRGGGGIKNVNGTLLISSSTITGNTANIGGGGIFSRGYSQTAQTMVLSSTISGNSASRGGGIYSVAYENGATVQTTVQNSTISGNTTSFSGGGIYNKAYQTGSTAVLTVTNSLVTGNQVASGSGGGVRNYAYYGNTQVTVTNSTISGNSSSRSGGGLSTDNYYSQLAEVTVTDSTLSGNSARTGGALHHSHYGGPLSNLTVTNSSISGNTATNGDGGALDVYHKYNTSNIQFTNSSISGNTARFDGGAIDVYSYYGTTNIGLANSTISGNSARAGGGIYGYVYSDTMNIGLTNSTVSGNSATRSGGGIYVTTNVNGTVGTANTGLVNSTITNNTADSDNTNDGNGGGIFVRDGDGIELTVLQNTILAGNIDASNEITGTVHPDGSGPMTANINNLIGNTAGITPTTPFTDNLNFSITGQDPLLGPLANNGGTNTASGEPPFTHLLQDSSPAIGEGEGTVCTNLPVLNVDQRGVMRDDPCEIGATEYVNPEIAISGAGQEITSGDTTPTTTDNTDFETVNINGGSTSKTFTINNTGPYELILGSVTLSGTNASDFSVTSQPTGPVAATNGSTTFEITFTPSATGTRTAEVSVANNDTNEGPYTFTIQGEGSDMISTYFPLISKQ